MFTTYRYNSGATQANILSDIVAILTGETTVANLSASCDKPNTTITSTIAAGWTLHDGSSGSNKKVIKSAYSDNGSAFKYVEIDLLSTTYFDCYIYEDFNSGTHTGTNISSNSGNYPQRIDLSKEGLIYISSSNRYINFMSLYESTYGDSYNSPLILNELTRVSPYNTTSYPSMCVFCIGQRLQTGTSVNTVFFSKLKDSMGGTLTGSNAKGKIKFPESCFDSKVYGTDINSHLNAYTMSIFSTLTGEFGLLYDTYLISYYTAPAFATVSIGSSNYIVFPCYGTTYAVLVRKD